MAVSKMAASKTAAKPNTPKRSAVKKSSSPQPTVRWTKSHQLVGLGLTLCPQRDIVLKNKIATALHGWFLEQVKLSDPALSAQLHDNQAEKAFVLSGILGVGAGDRRADGLLLRAGQPYQWVITGLSKPICNWLKDWTAELPAAIRFRGSSQLPIQSWEVVHAPTTYAQLLALTKKETQEEIANQLSAERPPTEKAAKVTFSFLSPTSFRSKGNHLPLPLPRNLFHSYLRRWNAFAAKPFEEEDFLDWVENTVTIARYDLHTQKTAVAKAGLVTGFVVTLTLSLAPKAYRHPQAKAYVQQFYTLANFSPYCGTGHKTTFGLGQTRLGQPAGATVKATAPAVTVVSAQAPSFLPQLTTEATGSLSPEVQQLAQQYTQTALRIEALKRLFLANRKQRGERATRKAAAMATIIARREAGESLKTIAQDLRLSYETAKSYSKWARKELATGEVRQK